MGQLHCLYFSEERDKRVQRSLISFHRLCWNSIFPCSALPSPSFSPLPYPSLPLPCPVLEGITVFRPGNPARSTGHRVSLLLHLLPVAKSPLKDQMYQQQRDIKEESEAKRIIKTANPSNKIMKNPSDTFSRDGWDSHDNHITLHLSSWRVSKCSPCSSHWYKELLVYDSHKTTHGFASGSCTAGNISTQKVKHGQVENLSAKN